MANFEWVIPQDSMVTQKHTADYIDVVIQVNAYRQISDQTISTQIPVCLGLTPPVEGFIPYIDLTYDIVCSWLNEGIDVQSLDTELAIQLDNIINPKTIVLPNPF